MKIHILYPFKDGPWGGANQFLKAVREYFIKIESYTENIDEADIVLFNSSPSSSLLSLLLECHKLKKNNQKILLINRIDGPVFFIRDRNLFVDKAFYKFNDTICDGTIFQSNWSKEKNIYLGMKKNQYETTILNAPNPDIFNKQDKKTFDKQQKTKLIATSWSNNIKKGFEVYKWMDENLDFSKYEMTFVGNSPFKFKNIILKEPMNSEALANELKSHDIFITASQSDPCSNSLIEAMHCGLPALGLDDGGHTEIISYGGEVFKTSNEISQKLDLIVQSYEKYQKNINLPTIDEVGELYFQFLKKIYDAKENNSKVKFPSTFDYIKTQSYVIMWRLEEKMYAIKRRVFN
jgi:glycosyltransferase involved in cell wall biosynthesis